VPCRHRLLSARCQRLLERLRLRDGVSQRSPSRAGRKVLSGAGPCIRATVRRYDHARGVHAMQIQSPYNIPDSPLGGC